MLSVRSSSAGGWATVIRSGLILALAVLALVASARDAAASFPGRNGDIVVTRWDSSRGGDFGYATRVNPVTGKLLPRGLSVCSNPTVADPHPVDTYCYRSGPAALSPDGLTAALIGKDESECDCSIREGLRLLPLEGQGRLIPFTNPVTMALADSGGYERVRWSPDGRQLLIDRPLNAAGGHAVYVAPADNPNQMRLVAEGSEADWSSDGRIVLVRHGNLYVGRIGSNFRRLTYRGGTQPSWSPHGRWLAFVRKRHLYRVPSKGGKARLIARRTGRSPVWSPDGRQVAFLRTETVHEDIQQTFLYRARIKDGKRRRIGLEFSSTPYGGYESARIYGPEWQARTGSEFIFSDPARAGP